MKTLVITRWLKILMLASLASLTFVGCTDKDSHWGIDHDPEIIVSHGPLDPKTGLYRCEKEDATLVEPGAEVSPLVKGTKIRLWHYKNSKEYVCVLKGKASIQYDR